MTRGENEFNDVYSVFYPKIRRFLSRRASEAEADDLTQVVFLKVSRALKDFRGESSLATWIYRIAANVVADRSRRLSCCDGSHESIEDQATTPEPGMRDGEPTPSLDQDLIRREMNECIRSIVDKLPEQSRAVIKLSEYDGLKNTEIAEVLGTTLPTVKIRLHRARLRLKHDLTCKCHLYRDERNELVCDPKLCL